MRARQRISSKKAFFHIWLGQDPDSIPEAQKRVSFHLSLGVPPVAEIEFSPTSNFHPSVSGGSSLMVDSLYREPG
jgi:hypothetical protein